MGVLTRSILEEATTYQKELPWLHIRVLNLNLHPTLRLPAMVLIAELRMLATLCRKQNKKLEPAMMTSFIKSRAKALGKTRNFQQASQVLLDMAGTNLHMDSTH